MRTLLSLMTAVPTGSAVEAATRVVGDDVRTAATPNVAAPTPAAEAVVSVEARTDAAGTPKAGGRAEESGAVEVTSAAATTG